MDESYGALTGMNAGASAPPAYYDNPKMLHVPTMAQRLEAAVKEAEQRLANAKRARELFNKNPDLEELLNILLLNILQRSNF